MTIEPGNGVGGEGGTGQQAICWSVCGLIHAFGLQYAESHKGEDSG